MKRDPVVRLGSVAEFIRGITFKPADVLPLGGAGAVACLRTKNVQETLDISDVWAVPEALVKRSNQLLRNGDILVSSANSWNLVGKCCWVPELPWSTTFGGFISALRPASADVLPRYLYWWFSDPHTQALVRSCGQKTTSISNLNLGRCLDLLIPLPSLDEQRRLTDILDRADTLRSKSQEALTKLEELPRATFHEMFGADERLDALTAMKALRELVRPDDQINYGVVQPGPEVEDGVPLVRISDLVDVRVCHQNLRKVSRDVDAKHARSRLRGDELLMSCVGSTGVLALATARERGFNVARAVARIPLNDCVDRTFVLYALMSPRVQQWIDRELRTVAQPTLNIREIEAIRVPVPALARQREFATRIEAIDKLKVQYKTHLEKLDELFASLQHRAFRGEL